MYFQLCGPTLPRLTLDEHTHDAGPVENRGAGQRAAQALRVIDKTCAAPRVSGVSPGSIRRSHPSARAATEYASPPSTATTSGPSGRPSNTGQPASWR
jgi:hypothetical protein